MKPDKAELLADHVQKEGFEGDQLYLCIKGPDGEDHYSPLGRAVQLYQQVSEIPVPQRVKHVASLALTVFGEDGYAASLPDEVMDWYGMSMNQGDVLTIRGEDRMWSQLADVSPAELAEAIRALGADAPDGEA